MHQRRLPRSPITASSSTRHDLFPSIRSPSFQIERVRVRVRDRVRFEAGKGKKASPLGLDNFILSLRDFVFRRRRIDLDPLVCHPSDCRRPSSSSTVIVVFLVVWSVEASTRQRASVSTISYHTQTNIERTSAPFHRPNSNHTPCKTPPVHPRHVSLSLSPDPPHISKLGPSPQHSSNNQTNHLHPISHNPIQPLRHRHHPVGIITACADIHHLLRTTHPAAVPYTHHLASDAACPTTIGSLSPWSCQAASECSELVTSQFTRRLRLLQYCAPLGSRPVRVRSGRLARWLTAMEWTGWLRVCPPELLVVMLCGRRWRIR